MIKSTRSCPPYRRAGITKFRTLDGHARYQAIKMQRWPGERIRLAIARRISAVSGDYLTIRIVVVSNEYTWILRIRMHVNIVVDTKTAPRIEFYNRTGLKVRMADRYGAMNHISRSRNEC